MIRVEDLSLCRGRRIVLEHVDLQVRPGEFLALLGPNGAGKSTLLSALAGELEPAAGAIFVDEVSLGELSPLQRAQRIALLPQESRIDFPLEVEEVVALGFLPHGPADPDVVDRALRRTGTAPLRSRLISELSGGERQRVQLARVLAQLAAGKSGRYLFLDEPTSNLDPAHQHGVLQLARQEADEGAAVVAVLHDLDHAALYADRAALLHRGRLVGCGEAAEILQPEFLEGIFGVPARQVIEEGQRRILVGPGRTQRGGGAAVG